MQARSAIPSDIGGVIAIASAFETYPPQPENVVALFDAASDCGGMFVAEHEGEIVGFLCAIHGPHAFTGRPAVNVAAWWVPGDRRGTGAGIALLREFLRWVSTLTLDMVTISAPLSSKLSVVLKAFGFQPVEVVHMLGHSWDVKGAGCQPSEHRSRRRAQT